MADYAPLGATAGVVRDPSNHDHIFYFAANKSEGGTGTNGQGKIYCVSALTGTDCSGFTSTAVLDFTTNSKGWSDIFSSDVAMPDRFFVLHNRKMSCILYANGAPCWINKSTNNNLAIIPVYNPSVTGLAQICAGRNGSAASVCFNPNTGAVSAPASAVFSIFDNAATGYTISSFVIPNTTKILYAYRDPSEKNPFCFDYSTDSLCTNYNPQ